MPARVRLIRNRSGSSQKRPFDLTGFWSWHYGSQAIGGVVNAINNRIPLMLPDMPFIGEISGAYATAAKAGDGSALFDARDGQFAFHADGYIRSAGDYDTPDGPQGNSWFKGDGASLGTSYFWGGSRVGGAIIHYDADYRAGQPIVTNDTDALVVDGMADYVRATLTSGGDVPLIPPYHVVVGGLSWYSTAFDANVHVYYTGAQNHPGATLTPTDGFVSLDMGVTYRPDFASGLEFAVIGKNLTDSRERNASALNHDLVELPGRNVRLVATYRF